MNCSTQAPITVPISYFLGERELRESIGRYLGRKIDPQDFAIRGSHWCIRVGGLFKPVTDFLRATA